MDRQANTGRAGSTAEFKRARNTYDITAAGEASWEAAQKVLTLERRVASLGQQRLRRIAATLDELRGVAQTHPVDGQRGEHLLITLRAEIAETVQGISAFMRELGEVMTLGERLEREPFLAYKARVVDHLQHFDPVQRESHARFTVAAEQVEAHLDALVHAIVAAGKSTSRATGRRPSRRSGSARPRSARTGARPTTGSSAAVRPHRGSSCGARSTARSTGSWTPGTGWPPSASAGWTSSSDYRRLAHLLVEDPESGPELFHLAFGMSPARHIMVPDPDEDQLADPAAHSWWTVAGLVMDRTLRQPAARSTTQGRTPRIPDVAQARRLAQLEADEEAKTTAQLRGRLLALDGKRLSDLDIVDDDTLAALDEWIMESGTRATGPEDRGPWRFVDGGRELAVALTAQPGRARLRTAVGKWDLEDLQLQVAPA